MKTVEANFDGLVGPTHNYAGLAYGNLASALNAEKPSNPREAALQGLRKMKALHDLGVPQGVLPPHERPHLPTLRALGFGGKDAEVLGAAHREAPGLLAAASSASAMWVANAATVSPSADAADGRVWPWVFGVHSNYWTQIAMTLRFMALTEGGIDKMKGKTVAHLYIDTAYGREPLPAMRIICEKWGITLLEIPIASPGLEQTAQSADGAGN